MGLIVYLGTVGRCSILGGGWRSSRVGLIVYLGTVRRFSILGGGAWADDHLGRLARRQHQLKGIGFLAVDRQAMLQANLHDPVGEPTPVLVWHPFDRVLGTLLSVDAGAGQGQVFQIVGECSASILALRAQAAVMGFGTRHDVLDLGLIHAVEAASCVRAVDLSNFVDDLGFDRLRIAIIVRAVRRAAVFRGDDDPPPSLVAEEKQDRCDDHDRCDSVDPNSALHRLQPSVRGAARRPVQRLFPLVRICFSNFIMRATRSGCSAYRFVRSPRSSSRL